MQITSQQKEKQRGLRASFFSIAATDQKPKAQAGLPEVSLERRTVTSFFPENKFQDAGGRAGGSSI